jgi:hypothetical protein
MKRKLLILVIALFVLGLSAGAYAIKLNSNAATANAACCDMDCCKDGHCPMGGDCCKGNDNCPMMNKQAATAEQTGDMKNVVMMGGGDNCCDHCKHKS